MNRNLGIIVFALLGITGLIAGCGESKPPAKTQSIAKAPTNDLPAPANAKLVLRLQARGDQVYTVQAGAGGAVEWSSATPDAKLFNEKGEQVGVHGKGPSWTLADGGTVIAQLPPAKKIVVDPTAVPWLEINAKASSAAGSLKEVTIIQRIKTTGGVPRAGDLKTENLGKQFKAAYTAEYLFYTAR